MHISTRNRDGMKEREKKSGHSPHSVDDPCVIFFLSGEADVRRAVKRFIKRHISAGCEQLQPATTGLHTRRERESVPL